MEQPEPSGVLPIPQSSASGVTTIRPSSPSGLLTVPQAPRHSHSGVLADVGRNDTNDADLARGKSLSRDLRSQDSFISAPGSASSERSGRPAMRRGDSFSSKLADVKKSGFFGKKAELAKSEELQAVSASLKAELNHLKGSFGDYMIKNDADVETVIAKMDANRMDSEARSAQALTDANLFTEKFCGKLRDELNSAMHALQERLQGGLESLRDALHEMRTNDLHCLGQRFDADLESLCADLCAQAAAREVEQATTLGHLQKTMGRVDMACRDQAARSQKAETEFSDRLASFEAIQRERNSLQDASLLNVEAKVVARVEQLATSLIDLAGKVDDLNCDTRNQGLENVESLREAHGTRLAAVEDVLGSFEKTVAEAGSVPTRRVEWSINNVSALLSEVAAAQESHESTDEIPAGESGFTHCRSWLSPMFHAAGAQNLQFEVRLLRPRSAQGTYGCELCLWGAKGLYLVSRLSIGDASTRLTHSFDGVTPCSTGHLCSISEQISFREDVLRVSVEIIEAVTSIQCSCPKDAAFTDYGTSNVESCNPDGSLTAQRYLNHGMLDLVQEEVNRMRSRMTRRIEWKLEQASMMLRCFPQGESLCSSTFMAAGLEGLQLIFYPSGYADAKDGFCSLFLFCPAGSTLRCWLSAGKQRREAARVSFDQPGFFGRTNFCRFENCVDVHDDSVLLALEIEEAQQTERQNLTHASASKRAANGVSLSSEEGAEPLRSCGECAPSQFDSVVKLQRVNGQLWKTSDGKPSLEDVYRLPSIWTSKAADRIGEALEGFHKFADMRQVKKPGSSSSARFVAGSTSSRGAEDSNGFQSQHTITQTSFATTAQTSRSDFWKNMPLAPMRPRTSERAYELNGSVPPRTPGRLPKYHAYA